MVLPAPVPGPVERLQLYRPLPGVQVPQVCQVRHPTQYHAGPGPTLHLPGTGFIRHFKKFIGSS